jgi:hypothetical protein
MLVDSLHILDRDDPEKCDEDRYARMLIACDRLWYSLDDEDRAALTF